MSENNLTARDFEILRFACQCFKSPEALKIDTDKLAQLAGFSNGKSANASWLVVKKKLVGNSSGQGESAVPGYENTAAKATPKKRVSKAKPKAATETEAGAQADDEQTPATTPKKAGGKKRKANETGESESCIKGEHADGTDEVAINGANGEAASDGSPAKKKRTRKPKDPNAPPPKPRAKKSAISVTPIATTGDDDEGDEMATEQHNVKTEEQDDEDRPFDAEEQELVKAGLADNSHFEDAMASGEPEIAV